MITEPRPAGVGREFICISYRRCSCCCCYRLAPARLRHPSSANRRNPLRAPKSNGSGAAPKSIGTTRSQRIPAFHTVHRGDTLYAVAWRYHLDYRELARWNGIKPPYLIYPSDRLLLRPRPRQPPRSTPTAPKATEPAPLPVRPKAKPQPATRISWRWPADGKHRNVDSTLGRKGLEIRGVRGQAIRAAAPGTVVYSGSGLIGYGKLIIIKHNDVFLSAYAHNDSIVVEEGTSVSGGQKIAEMGSSNAKEAMLHFEIRRNGKPVPPLQYLPKSS